MLFSRGLFFYWENFQRATFGPTMRTLGQSILKVGNSVQGEFLNNDRCNLNRKSLQYFFLSFNKKNKNIFILKIFSMI